MLYAGLDVHKEFVQAAWVDGKNRVVREERFETTQNGLNDLCAATRGARCVIESSTACFQVYDALKQAKVRVRVAHPLRIKAIASAKIKTDAIDARTLAQLERANLIPESHIPSKKIRDLRTLIRHQVSLTREATRIKNRVKSMLLKQGLTHASSFTSIKRTALIQEASGNARLMLEQSFEQLRFLEKQKRELNHEIQLAAQANPDAVLLKTMPGVGWFSALLLAVEIDDAKRFPDAEHLQSYAGLVPSTRQSGSVTHTGPISKQGNALLRWVLVQDAWQAIRYSTRFRKTFLRVRRKHNCKKAIIAVARRMLRCAYFMLTRRQAFCENA